MSQGQISDNARRWLQTIRYAEGTAGPNGYSTTFGYQSFDPSKGHPRRVVRSGGYASDAAGAYQFLSTTWDAAARGAGVNPAVMTPENQDRAALYLMRQRGVDPDQPISPDSVAKLAPEWASLPTKAGRSYYGQPVRGYNSLLGVWGGKVQPTQAGGGGGGASAAASGGAAPALSAGGDDGSGTLALATLLSSSALGKGSAASPLQGLAGNAVMDSVTSSPANTAAQALLRQQTEDLSSEAMTSGRRAQLAKARGESARGTRPSRFAGSPGQDFMQRVMALAQPLASLF